MKTILAKDWLEDLIFMFRWEVSEWSRCRAECNGLKTRNVECVSDEAGAKLLVTATSHYLQIIRKLKRSLLHDK